MRLRILFAKYGDDLMPNALVVTDEYMEDEHRGIPNAYLKGREMARVFAGPETPFVEAFVTVNDDDVEALFERRTLQGHLVSQAEEA